MATTPTPAAPIDAALILPDALVDQLVKPASNADADLISAYRLAAINWVETHTARLANEAEPLRVAALLLIKHLYDGGSIDEVPATVAMLCQPYRTPVIG